MSTEPDYQMAMPFVTVTSKGGPHDDQSYVAGFECGRIDALLGAMSGLPARAEISVWVHSENERQVDLIGMKHGFLVECVSEPDGDWSLATFTVGELDE
jgi:hypothetical protein